MKIELAKTAGFCFGVRRAVETVYDQVEKNRGGKIYTYGLTEWRRISTTFLRAGGSTAWTRLVPL